MQPCDRQEEAVVLSHAWPDSKDDSFSKSDQTPKAHESNKAKVNHLQANWIQLIRGLG